MPHDRDARPDSTDKDASSIAELAMTVDALAERLEAAEIAIRALQDNEKNTQALQANPRRTKRTTDALKPARRPS